MSSYRRGLMMHIGDASAVNLIVGDNGTIGVKTYEYLWETYGSTYVSAPSEEIYLTLGGTPSKINIIRYGTSHGISPSCGEGIQIYADGGGGYVLCPDGSVVFISWEVE